MDNLHTRGILRAVHVGDYLITWNVSIYCIRLGSQVCGSFLGEFPKSHGDIVDDEHNLSSPDGRLVREDYLDFRGHATGMRP